MKREELLTKLAMEINEWPGGTNLEWPDYVAVGWQEVQSMLAPSGEDGGACITKQNWLAERERLINKPDWKDAPKWVKWLAQQPYGHWAWFSHKPRFDGRSWTVPRTYQQHEMPGSVPAGHDWRQTLEERPGDPLITCPAPRDLVTDLLIKRCDELEEDKAFLADENQRLRRIIADLAG